jgi:hypothetical protein
MPIGMDTLDSRHIITYFRRAAGALPETAGMRRVARVNLGPASDESQHDQDRR